MKDYKKMVLCYGDSNTHGYNSLTMGRFTEEERWPCLLQKLLGEKWTVREEGLGGRTTVFTDPLFEGLSGLDYLYPCMMTHEPLDLLIIMLGTNDVKERFSATPENIAKGLERLVKKAMDSSEAWREGKNILIVAPLPIEPGYKETLVAGEMGNGCVEKSEALAPLYRECAQRLGCGFLDASQIRGMKMSPGDYMNLSLESHRILAEALADKIKREQ